MGLMLLAALHQVDKHYGEQLVLKGVTLELRAASRLALIGRNGSGKTTILRLLLGQETPDGGEVYRRQGVTLAMLTQDPQFAETASVMQASEQAFAELDAMELELQGLERAGLDDHDRYERWEALHEVFIRRGGYERRARRDAVLHALGFRGREQILVRHLSGGERTRLGLARLLMAQPDALLLDEPTNHLDLDMREWLEGYLSRYPGAVLLVSHDRAFLDGAGNATAEIKLGTLRTFAGNPSAYQAYRLEQLRIEAKTRYNQQREYQRLEAAAEQMKRWARQNAKLHRRAKAMFTRLSRYELQMLPEAERHERTARFSFDCQPSAELVVQAAHLSKRFDGHKLFDHVSVTVRQGERIALVGPNGAGKTTFVRVLLGELASDDPRAHVHFGARVRVGYYDQQLRGVDPALTLIEELIRLVGDVEAHNLLGNFLFPYDAQYKRIADLSGGERARLAILKLTLGNYNLLVLDEPTNHLDVEMIEALEMALDDYQGTVLTISHDRRFLEATTELVWELQDGRFIAYEGDWEYYHYKRRERRGGAAQVSAETAVKPAAAPPVTGPSKWQLTRQLEALEARIAELEAEVGQLDEALADPQQLDTATIATLGEQHTRLEGELLAAIASWEEVSEQLAKA